MKNYKNASDYSEAIESQVEPFVTRLKLEGYAGGTVCTKRAALRRFLCWRLRRTSARDEPSESEVASFLARSSQLAPGHRCLAATALVGFLKHLRERGLITTCPP